ncbi:MAG: tRNA epoxyqueuosine(34) reductase QueG [Proteobacteria bacterium]|nr:tRNA epoxyqueuosine(34) reductase QueG [Pseudomonadota bacterium]
MESAEAKSTIRAMARRLGFDGAGFAPPVLDAEAGRNLARYLDLGFHGDMDWLFRRAGARAQPKHLWPEVKSVIVLTLNYGPSHDPLEILARPDLGAVSVYAQGRDYHDVVKKRLKALGRWLVGRYGCDVKVFVDTAPVMEKPLAEQAGIGWQGKHTNLVSRRHGSWLFLGEIFTTLELPADAAEADHCGSCHRCLDVCPTDAFPAPYRLDPRRCISYLTIEHKGHIAREFRKPMGNRIYGCDDCLAVCPWNKYASSTKEYAFEPRAELTAPKLADLAGLDDAGFRKMFAGSAIKRIGRARFVRNVLIALGNSGDAAMVPVIAGVLADPSPLVRAMAVWALTRLMDPGDFDRLRARHAPGETDAGVAAEWRAPVKVPA